jgi:hypothetical protein
VLLHQEAHNAQDAGEEKESTDTGEHGDLDQTAQWLRRKEANREICRLHTLVPRDIRKISTLRCVIMVTAMSHGTALSKNHRHHQLVG